MPQINAYRSKRLVSRSVADIHKNIPLLMKNFHGWRTLQAKWLKLIFLKNIYYLPMVEKAQLGYCVCVNSLVDSVL